MNRYDLPGDPTLPPGVTHADLEERNREPVQVRCAYCLRFEWDNHLEDGLCGECIGEED